jgi:hypothetical protein
MASLLAKYAAKFLDIALLGHPLEPDLQSAHPGRRGTINCCACGDLRCSGTQAYSESMWKAFPSTDLSNNDLRNDHSGSIA